ncbi:hypothetical protein ACFE04_031089 [Oxalis oulophora]
MGWKARSRVKEGKNTYVVKTLSNSCSCRAWDLQGILCRHAKHVMTARSLLVDDFVSNWFKKELYCDLYQNYLPNPMKPLNGPPPRILLGRPRRKIIPELASRSHSPSLPHESRRPNPPPHSLPHFLSPHARSATLPHCPHAVGEVIFTHTIVVVTLPHSEVDCDFDL